ncbi:MAG: NAD(P)-dependent glycerol-3-phosphate dehydrogenase [Candidatus Zixiibacteriota bacterium]|nr:MAG: NAD(P)-dependent glycerol-3-phosphate dehydrogenase [candidate division Zixibacteria bacterium]
MPEHTAVLGAGSWGIAIANCLASNGHRVTLWEFDRSEYQNLVDRRCHPTKLPDIFIPPETLITNDLEEAVSEADFLVLAIPAQKIRQVCLQVNEVVHRPTCCVNLAKGVEIGTLMRMSEVLRATLSWIDDDHIATLSGPSHAEEVARNVPTSVVAASTSLKFAERIQRLFSSSSFRVYRSQDIIGVELGGSLKNVVAIAAGVTSGLGYGDNTMGALITRGLAEISRMGVKLGADPLTFAGLSGIGDLITTCISPHSRNRYVGNRIGKGEMLEDILRGMVMVAEGVDTCRSAEEMARRYQVDMPITREVYNVLFENKDPSQALVDLMGRSLKEEVWH